MVAILLWASGGIQSAYNTIQNAGTPLTKRQTVNFTGTGVSCTDSGGITVCTVTAGAGGYSTIQNSGTPLTQRTTVNMQGTGVSCADAGGITVCTINGTGVANFSQAFTTQTSVTITHNLGTSSVLTQCFDNASPPNLIVPQNVAITSINVVTVTFSVAQSGTCVVNGAAAGTATSVPFSGITTATNSTATMTVGTGATVNRSGSGVIDANQVNSATIPASATLTGTNGGNQFISQTAAVATAFLNLFTNVLQGLVPASGGGTTNFLRADGTWAAPPGTAPTFTSITTGTNTTATMTCGTGCTVNRSGTGIIDANQVNSATIPANATLTGTNGSNQFISQTAAVATAFLNLFTNTLQGLVPASGGGTTNFLRADATWAAPPGPTALALSIATKTTTYTFLGTDYAIVGDTTGGGFTVNLEAAPATGQIHVIKKAVAANTLTLGGNGKNIDGAANVAITIQYVSYTVQYDGTQWWIE